MASPGRRILYERTLVERSRTRDLYDASHQEAFALDAVQVHGGYGYMHNYCVEKIMRDVKVLQLLGGSSPALNIQSIRGQL